MKSSQPNPHTVLIVEDSKTVGVEVQKILQQEGFRTEWFTKGMAALAWLAENRCTLLLLDYRLPDMTGQQVIESLPEWNCKTAFIIMTAYGDERLVVQMMKLGARDYLIKDKAFYDLLPSVVSKVIGQLETEKKLVEAEQALRENEERFRKIFEEGPLGMAIVDLDYHLIKVNRKLCQMVGYTEEELTALTFVDITHPEDIELEVQLVQQLFKYEIPHYKVEKRFIKKNRELLWVALTASVIRGKDEKSLYRLEMIEDITEQKQAGEDLRMSREYLDTILLNLHVGVAILEGPEFRYFRTNHVLAEINGLSIEDHLDRPLAEVLPDAADNIIPGLREVFETGAASPKREFSMKLPGEPNKLRHFIDSFFPITGIDGKPKAVGAVVLDITERKQAEEKVRNSLIEKELLLKEIHHRVKNNLQVISSLLSLQSKSISNREAQKILQASQDRVQSMAFIHEMLYQSPDLATINFEDYLKSLTSNLYHSYASNPDGIALVVDAKDVSIDINKAMTCGLIVNELVANSLKYAFPNGRQGEIRIEIRTEMDDRYIMSIGDNGIGLPKGFDFNNSTSLGLRLVNMFVKQLKSAFEVHRNKRTEFEIIFKG